MSKLNKDRIQQSIKLRKDRRGRVEQRNKRSLLDVLSLSNEEFSAILAEGIKIKTRPEEYETALSGCEIALLFQKTSTRTRVSFESGIAAMGGSPLVIDWQSSNFTRASLKDEVRVLSRFTDLIAARLNRHRDLEEMAAHSEVPVINGLTDLSHPCQGLADFMTIAEYFGSPKGVSLTYVGDGNNVCHSLMNCSLKASASITLSCPPEYSPSAELCWNLQRQGLDITFEPDAKKAVSGADVIYTDAFISMGEDHLHESKLKDFAGYQVNEEVMAAAPAHALFMHCLPAHRGEEVSDGVLDSENSVVFDQAENRRHVQLALILFLLRENGKI